MITFDFFYVTLTKHYIQLNTFHQLMTRSNSLVIVAPNQFIAFLMACLSKVFQARCIKCLWGLYVGGLIINYLDTLQVQTHIIFFFIFYRLQ